jgi:predicted dehydrogenase
METGIIATGEDMEKGKRLGIGFVGSGFITRFHIRSWVAVRDADILGVWSPNGDNSKSAATLARSLGVGDARAYGSITEMVADPDIDCLWLCGPNHRRIENMEEIVQAIKSGKGELIGIACEKPLGRNVPEARRMVELAEEAQVLHAYLENQLYSPSLVRGREIAWKRGASNAGRPYLARAAEEHGGPHMPWFWQGELQGGGVLNDMMCHSVEVARFLLTEPGAPRNSIRPVKVTGHIASLKWSRPEYSQVLRESFGPDVDYARKPSEDFARATIEYRDMQNRCLIAETTTSWSYVGAGLRLSSELLGPEYMLQVNSLDTSGKVFFSRQIQGAEGEDMIEKQNAEQGLMPIVGNETSEYGYEDENRSFVQAFLRGEQPGEDFHAGLEVTELLMTAYMSAEQERTIDFRPEGLDDYVPAVATGTWSPDQ